MIQGKPTSTAFAFTLISNVTAALTRQIYLLYSRILRSGRVGFRREQGIKTQAYNPHLPQVSEKNDAKWLSLATASILGQAPIDVHTLNFSFIVVEALHAMSLREII